MTIRQLEIIGMHGHDSSTDPSFTAPSTRALRREETWRDLLSCLPTPEDMAWQHSGLCQVGLPHRKPKDNREVWRRVSGDFTLMITPGVIDDSSNRGRLTQEENQNLWVGVPFGVKARLIMIYLQTEGLKSRTVSLGSSLSNFMRSLGLGITGGERGTITAVREQCLRIARCSFTLQWAQDSRVIITDNKIVTGLELWRSRVPGNDWNGTVELSPTFHDHLREHAVPLDKRGIALLSGNSLGLDLYTMLAYRLQKMSATTHISWEMLQTQIGSESSTKRLAAAIREVMPRVHQAYPDAKVEVTRHGLRMNPSPPPVPRTMVAGFRTTVASQAIGG